MANEVNVDGIAVEIDVSALSSIDMLEAYYDMQYGDIFAVVKVARSIFGGDWERIRSELNARHGGKASIADVVVFINDCITALAGEREAAKN